MSVLDDTKLDALLARLHARHEGQSADIVGYFQRRAAAGELRWEGFDADAHAFVAGELVALEPRISGKRRIPNAGPAL